jgi:protein TonB
VATSDKDRLPSDGGATTLISSDFFASTLGFGRGGLSSGRWLSAPLGLAMHAAALAALGIAALWAPIANVPPSPAPLVLTLAPPPPPPLRQGSPLGVDGGAVAPTTSVIATPTNELTFIPQIADAMLTPSFDVPFGVEDGFAGGSLDGMAGGIPGGVVGGVPGGIVGGTVGGTGRDLPKFPAPDVGPSPLAMPQPSYTRQAIRDNVTGTVVLRVVIDEQGKVQVLKVLRSIPELDDEAIRVVESRWRFQPATKNGRPVPTLSDLVVRFNLF